jgi:hypothetical protein
VVGPVAGNNVRKHIDVVSTSTVGSIIYTQLDMHVVVCGLLI